MALRAKKPAFLLPMRVWDGATRLVHWTLPVLLLTSYLSVTNATGPHAGLLMQIHLVSGETMLALLLFRLIWGVIGSDTARFSRFLKSPLAAFRHLAHIGRREPDTQIGHNAAGGWMVLVMLGVLLVQVGTGLFANDDGDTEGPLAQFVSKDMSDTLSRLHILNVKFIVALVAIHLLALAFYAVVKRQNLLRAMVTGKKRLPATSKAPRMASRWLALGTLALAAGITVAISRL